MSDSRWQRIEEIFHRAVELAPESRTAFLDEACGSLLAYESQDGDTFAGPVAEGKPGIEADASHPAALTGMAGPYRIDGLLGAGRMGEVYRGWDTRLRRAVALKFLAREFLSDAAAVERFEREDRVGSAGLCGIRAIGPGSNPACLDPTERNRVAENRTSTRRRVERQFGLPDRAATRDEERPSR